MTYLKDKLYFGSQFVNQTESVSLWEASKRMIQVFHNSRGLLLRFSYPFEFNNLYTNEILQHLLTTANKSPSLIFTIKVFYEQQRPVQISFQLFNPQFSNNSSKKKNYKTQIPVPMKFFRFPRQLYEKIVNICQQYTIRHSQLAQANEFINFLIALQEQQNQFLLLIDGFLRQLTIDERGNIDFGKSYDAKYPFDI